MPPRGLPRISVIEATPRPESSEPGAGRPPQHGGENGFLQVPRRSRHTPRPRHLYKSPKHQPIGPRERYRSAEIYFRSFVFGWGPNDSADSTALLARSGRARHFMIGPHVRLDNRDYFRQPSRLRYKRDPITTPSPAPSSQAHDRTILLTGVAGPTLVHASAKDLPVLLQAGLRAVLRELSDEYGAAVDLVAQIYECTGDLDVTTTILKGWKGSNSITEAE